MKSKTLEVKINGRTMGNLKNVDISLLIHSAT